MKALAFSPDVPPPRRYVPERDGYWDGFAFEIDPDFPVVADAVNAHRRTPIGRSHLFRSSSAPSERLLGFDTASGQVWRLQALHPRMESTGWAVPPQIIRVLEQRCVRP